MTNHFHLVLRPHGDGDLVERNPLRADLVERAEDWRWSSLPDWIRGDPLLWRGEPPLRDAAVQEVASRSISTSCDNESERPAA
ncbi:hypothetical protein [Paludisphaera borealis]|uniref:hypothetical protein n=1 Tax=Paludisphaera borealis TaxID=1387353 RepID=UPI0009710F43|nr:hypothetical protein [Paludisphaera borealis]